MKLKVAINRRVCKLLVELNKQDDYVSIIELSRRMGFTRCNVEYDMTKLNTMFEELNLPMIDAISNKGILLPQENKDWFKELTKDFKNNITYVYSKEERVAYCLCSVIIGSHNYSAQHFSEILGVSRSTIFLDLMTVREIVEANNGRISYDRFYKYYIQASGEDYMKMLRLGADTFLALIPIEMLPFILDDSIVELIEKFNRARKELRKISVNKMKLSPQYLSRKEVNREIMTVL